MIYSNGSTLLLFRDRFTNPVNPYAIAVKVTFTNYVFLK